MTDTELAAIEKFSGELWLGHRYCEDQWYSCPLHEEGCANDAEKECTCDQTDRAGAKAAIDTLLAEVARLQAWQRKVVNEVEVAQMHTPSTDPSQEVFDSILEGAP